MNWLKENWFKILISFCLFIITSSSLYYFVLKKSPINKIVPSKEESLREQWKNYNNLVMVGLCQQAYDNYLTNDSKKRNSFTEFESFGCLDRKREIQKVDISYVVFTDNNRAEIKLNFKPADINIYYHWDVETWYLENNKWLRDF